jgi:hypothetical protein
MAAGPYICSRLQRLPEAAASRLLTDDEARIVFWKNERELCEHPDDGFLYWVEAYGSHIDASGSQLTLELWPWQREFCKKLTDSEALISVKSRRVGMTVLVLHYVIWMALFSPDSDQGNLAIFSLNHKAAKAALKLVRKFLEAQPAGLVPVNEWGAEGACTDTTEEIGFTRGSSIVSYAANGGARGQTLRLAFWDEAARAEGAIDAAQSLAEAIIPAVEGGGQLIVASTGQGRSGRGEVFARLWDRAASKELDWDTWFVSRFDRPGRDEAWWKKTLLELGEMRAEQEYPLDPDQALAGDQEGAHLPVSHINAAVALGTEWKEARAAGELQPVGNRIWLGLDWGMNTASVVVIPLSNGDVYIAAEYQAMAEDAETFTRNLIATALPFTDGRATISHLYYDSAGAQQALSMRPVVQALSPKTRPEGVRFNKTRKATVEYIRGALERNNAGAEFARIGIDPSCHELIRQMKDGRMAEDGDRQKGDDHTFDSLIAALADHAYSYQRAASRINA